MVVNTRDITERKASEELLKKHNEDLKKINSELDGFVYRASHDLRAPLSSILGLIEICKAEKDKKLQLDYLDMMDKSVKKLDLFIKNIIDFSRNSRLEVSSTPVNFQELVNGVFDEYKYMERSTEIERKVIIKGSENFYSDIFRLKIIFSNMISNAIRYSNPNVKSFIHIFIDINKENATIEFRDNGRGIAKESLNRVFDMFYRASEYNVGSGLGLYIVKEVIHGLNGSVKVESKYGEGSTFTVKIPNLIGNAPNSNPQDDIVRKNVGVTK
jgi:signal transduction histidine kinase